TPDPFRMGGKSIQMSRVVTSTTGMVILGSPTIVTSGMETVFANFRAVRGRINSACESAPESVWLLWSVTKERSLSGVAHDIAHHAGSGLSCLMPHLAQALREALLETTAVELLDEEPYPMGVAEVPTLRLVLGDLKQSALRILKKYGFERPDVLSIKLHGT